MEFGERKAIHLQIADRICETVISGIGDEEERIPSIRELAMEIEVNPNTVTRAYHHLQDQKILYNQRGISSFIAAGAEERTRMLLKEDFLRNERPSLFERMDFLGIPRRIWRHSKKRTAQRRELNEDEEQDSDRGGGRSDRDRRGAGGRRQVRAGLTG